MTSYPSLNALRKKDAQSAVAHATQKPAPTMANNPMVVKKLKSTRSKRTALKVGFVAIALLLISGTVFAARMLTVGGGLFGNGQSDGFFASLRALFGDSRPLIGEDEDRVNVLLLGIGGEGHDGANLSDTIMIASLKPSTNEAALLSIPRDLYVQIDGYGQNKLNSAFAFGEEYGYPGGGAQLATETIEQITGLELPYYVVADFKGFEKIVDDLGGLDVDIPYSFYDELHAIQYDEGVTHFNGNQALYFTRARYVPGEYGGDFHRAERTQVVLKALQQKALALNPVADLNTITGILQNLGDHVRTNLQPAELRRVYELVHDLSFDKVQNKVIDDAETGLVYGSGVNMGGLNVSVLLPSDPSFEEIQTYAASVFDPAPPEPEDATLEVHNGTETAGIAANFGATLKTDVEITGSDNADQSDYEETFIVDNTDGDVPNALAALQAELKTLGIDARVVTDKRYPNESTADLVLVLGQDYVDATEE